jgi:hypothetical protein
MIKQSGQRNPEPPVAALAERVHVLEERLTAVTDAGPHARPWAPGRAHGRAGRHALLAPGANGRRDPA